MTNKERMLQMVLDDKKLQEQYDYDQSEYEDMYTAINSDNVLVGAVARIIKGLDIKEQERTIDPSIAKKVYNTVINYLNENLLL